MAIPFRTRGLASSGPLAAIALGAMALAPSPVAAQSATDRVPAETWMRFSDPAEAGFDPAALEAARQTWESIPSSAFLVIADGAVVAAWGETERRFMCHSVRKSFLSGLYGIYWDRGEIELNKTLAELGIDDTPDPLLESEKQARILDLLKARSGVFRAAAYSGRTDSRPRGSEGPGRYFAYNNWDFNTAAAILTQETGADVFEAFDEHFAGPLGMQDWRITDGYYHFERDKSQYPAYPFRMSARDMARFGLLYTRHGMWGDRRILSRHWVQRSSALYSVDNPMLGYGLYWWVFQQPPFSEHGMYAALGVGSQLIAVLPESDLVIVNRANTYEGEGTPPPQLLGLIGEILAARTGSVAEEPALEPLEEVTPDPRQTRVPEDRLAEYAGEFPVPPPSFGLPADSATRIAAADGYLVAYNPQSGTFATYVQDDGSLYVEDLGQIVHVVRDSAGAIEGLARDPEVLQAAAVAAADGRHGDARELLRRLSNRTDVRTEVVRSVVALVGESPEEGERAIRALVAAAEDGGEVGAEVAFVGRFLLGADRPEAARTVFALNADMHPDVPPVWRDLGAAHEALGEPEAAIAVYETVLELSPDDRAAREALDRLRSRP